MKAMEHSKVRTNGSFMMKESDWNHLAKITMANLPPGKINLTEDEIFGAMTLAVAKESTMCQQLLTDNRKLGEFQAIIAPVVWDAAHRN